eukprot:gnl/TRDRNA2_/TRDRNA2_174364_c0_seq1.p1 gnl/TRDRNA2_/TRDRNA2_174364_c0~~gnl/TRDRNA2_/TRDRNA2_174364_c0_seq1.p1  ORF type:complete len:219 (+),score=30.15 gnl/TRDRNA2_/TRDRNA2_174364_c0_seq1:43-699(+)
MANNSVTAPTGIDKLSWWCNLLTVLNHGIFATLFIWRNIHAGGDFDMERAVRAEAGTICALTGCDSFDVAKRIALVLGEVLGKDADGTGTMWLGTIFFYYMGLEGCLHIGICIGGLIVLTPGPLGVRRCGLWAQKLYRSSLMLEMLLMDIPYTIIYSVVPIMYANSSHLNTQAGTFASGAHFGFFIALIAMLQHVSCVLDLWAYIVEVMRTPYKSNYD